MKITNRYALEKIANDIRIGVIEAVYHGKSGHPGGSLSASDIMSVLFFNQMNIDPKNPRAEGRDRFVLSKGHCSPVLYSTLARKGYFDKELLKTFRKMDSKLQGHPDMNKLLGVDMTSGSLGQGLSVANGMALNSKLEHAGYRVYCLVGDGELEEGQIWEACMTSSKYELDNLCLIVDNNGLQIDGTIEEVKGMKHIYDKFKSFGFNVISIDGNNVQELVASFDLAKQIKGRPTVIIAKTVKGKGVSFMENQVAWHGKAPNEEEYNMAIKELNEKQEHITNMQLGKDE